VYNLKNKPDAPSTTNPEGSSTKFGANAGAGFDMAVGSAKVFLEARFHNVFKGAVDLATSEEKSANFVPITVGVKFGG
jgi:hypothetical protein